MYVVETARCYLSQQLIFFLTHRNHRNTFLIHLVLISFPQSYMKLNPYDLNRFHPYFSVYVLKSVQFNFSKNLLYAFKCISMCSLLAFPLILMEIFLSLSMAQIFLVILISLFLYLIFLFFSDGEIRQFIKNLHT